MRRYRCRACSAVILVHPRGLLRRFRFRPAAMLLALASWGLDGKASGAVRQSLCPRQVVAHDGWRHWAAPRRWLRTAHRWAGTAVGEVLGSRAERVEAVLQQLASRALHSTGDLLSDALAVARMLGGHGVCAGGQHLSTS